MSLVVRLRSAGGWRGRGLDIALGGLAVLGHAPFHLWPLAILCWAFLMLRLDAARSDQPLTPKIGFGRGFWFGLGYFLFGTFWIGSAFIVRGPEFIPAMPPMILGLAALLAFFWGAAGYIYVRFFGDGNARWIGLACLLLLAEAARGHAFGGLPWNLPGYVIESGGAISQIAAYVGIYGLSFIVLLLSAGIARVLSGSRYYVTGGLCLVLIACLYAFGSYRLSSADISYVDGVKIRIVQVPFSQKDKFDADKSIGIVNEFIRTSLEPGLDDITHIIWPEGAVVGMALENRPLLDAMGRSLAYETDTPPYWLLNSLRFELEPVLSGPPRELYYNTSAIVSYDTNGTPAIMGLNDKRRLVPFGEFFPGGRWVEDLGSKTLSTSLASITPAPEKTLARFPGLPIVSPQICYEIIFPGLTPRPKTGSRAAWILNQSNDAWYGRSVGPAQHANIAAYRALEEGLPVVRSASNGVSGLIDPYGRYLKHLNAADKGVVDIRLPKPLKASTLTRHHNLVLFLIVLFITVISYIISRRMTRADKL